VGLVVRLITRCSGPVWLVVVVVVGFGGGLGLGVATAASWRQQPHVLLDQYWAPGHATPDAATIVGQARNRRCALGPQMTLVARHAQVVLAVDAAISDGSGRAYVVCRVGGRGFRFVSTIVDTPEGDPATTAGSGLFTVAGDYLAWQTEVFHYGESLITVNTLNVATWHHRALILDNELAPGADPPHAVGIAIDRDGDLAWQREGARRDGPVRGDLVQAWTVAGVVTLDSAPSNICGALAFAKHRTLRWTNAGQPRSYTFR
jgi:hypothetical protein